MDEATLCFEVRRSPRCTSDETRASLLADPGFGRVFTDHMVIISYSEGRGWHDARVQPRGPIALDPAAAVLHYAQEIFEGLKAYRTSDDSVALFRPYENARRFRASAERMAMPPLDEELFVRAVEELIRIDRNWIPEGDGSLYLRPFMFASEAFLGVRPAKEYQFIVIASPVGNYFKGNGQGITLWVSDTFSRAGRGGTGSAKCGGNYAASLRAQAEALEHGCDQVVFLDASESRWVEELGGMNLFFVFDDGTLITPPLGGTILPGITRDALMTLARDQGLRVLEARYSIADWRRDAATGRLVEAFACGTAAVVTPIHAVRGTMGDFEISKGQLASTLRQQLVAIQRGAPADPRGWVHRVL